MTPPPSARAGGGGALTGPHPSGPAAGGLGPVPRTALAPLATGAVVAAATVYVALVDPHRPGHYLTCPLLALTGLACPGCGGLRATHDLARLDVAGAWAANPLWVLVAPLIVALWAVWLVRAWRGRPGPRLRAGVAWAGLAVVVAFGVLRNVPALTGWLGPGA
ncbi:DUF2752 domain-containing protein [Cellulosimicrobium cellulans]|uniref:DUF2752 domain-containing protein n=1 Tax=Cellulosimicrobium cellulans TaxID=1710 RepID=UPI000848DBBA|nr:DUF2752 domain-containing protein [Cellulosimicrobium cellulans]